MSSSLHEVKGDAEEKLGFYEEAKLSYLKELEWENARATFISAEEIFNDKHYSKLMIPLYQSIDNVSLIKQ